MISPKMAANTCGGTTFSHFALIEASTKMRAREEIPSTNTFGSIFINSDGVSATMPQNSWA